MRSGSNFGRVSRSLVSQCRTPLVPSPEAFRIMKVTSHFFTDSNRLCCRSRLSFLQCPGRFVFAAMLWAFSTSLFASNPSSPQNLRSSVYSPTAAELFWNASTDADGIAGYRVYISGNLYRQVPGTSVYIDVLHPGNRYDFQISAVDGKGSESQWTSVHSLVTGSSACLLYTSDAADE